MEVMGNVAQDEENSMYKMDAIRKMVRNELAAARKQIHKYVDDYSNREPGEWELIWGIEYYWNYWAHLLFFRVSRDPYWLNAARRCWRKYLEFSERFMSAA